MYSEKMSYFQDRGQDIHHVEITTFRKESGPYFFPQQRPTGMAISPYFKHTVEGHELKTAVFPSFLHQFCWNSTSTLKHLKTF
jgi:hypothetical protein